MIITTIIIIIIITIIITIIIIIIIIITKIIITIIITTIIIITLIIWDYPGILVYYQEDVRWLFNMKLFVDTDADTRLARRGEKFGGDDENNVGMVWWW